MTREQVAAAGKSRHRPRRVRFLGDGGGEEQTPARRLDSSTAAARFLGSGGEEQTPARQLDSSAAAAGKSRRARRSRCRPLLRAPQPWASRRRAGTSRGAPDKDGRRPAGDEQRQRRAGTRRTASGPGAAASPSSPPPLPRREEGKGIGERELVATGSDGNQRARWGGARRLAGDREEQMQWGRRSPPRREEQG
uniref:Uncharacterized protein n=1 Tax=Oryza barthii TaxID=65489 RepID=A0A0D3GFE6_9ORYZ